MDPKDWNARRRVEDSDPDPKYFDDTTPQGAEKRRQGIHAKLDEFIDLLGGRSIEDNLKV